MINNERKDSFQENLDSEKLVFSQIRACNMAHNEGDEISFGNAVMQLLAIIPSSMRKEIKAQEEEYLTEDEIWVSLKIGGMVLSNDPENPVIINRKGIDLDYDPNFNGGKPKQISPILKKDVNWDYYILFVMIQEALEKGNISWKPDRTRKGG